MNPAASTPLGLGCGLLTDFYELTMMNGQLDSGLAGRRACFDLFARRNPFNGGYMLAAGLADALRFLRELRFGGDEIAWMREQRVFGEAFLDQLKGFRFTGDVWAVPEGTPVFPRAPIMRLEGTLLETTLVESALLTIVNFQTLVATKAARIVGEAQGRGVLEFGLRRAQGLDGAYSATRAAHIGGAAATSNAHAARVLGIPAKGTHAHAWVMSFDTELEAFRAFAKTFPDDCVLLVDTYDTLRSGVPNAIQVAKELRAAGHELKGVRLDSGDLAYLSREARRLLDAAGFPDAKIVASSDLDEHLVRDLLAQDARIDLFGVGTNLVTAEGDPHLTGVYKLAAIQDEGAAWRPRMKLSENVAKETLPGVKQVWRAFDADGMMMGDAIALDEEGDPGADGPFDVFNPLAEHQSRRLEPASLEPLLRQVMRAGEVVAPSPTLPEIQARAKRELARLHATSRRLANPHVYKVSVTRPLLELRARLRKEHA